MSSLRKTEVYHVGLYVITAIFGLSHAFCCQLCGKAIWLAPLLFSVFLQQIFIFAITCHDGWFTIRRVLFSEE